MQRMSSFIAVNLNSNTDCIMRCMVKCKNGMNLQLFNEFECSLQGSLWNKSFKSSIIIIEDVSNKIPVKFCVNEIVSN